MHRRASLIAFALLLTALGWSEIARAQTVAPGNLVNPERLVDGVEQSPRPQNLTPLGINYSDCIQDMVLQFPIVVSGFDGSESMQVWATKSGDCTQDQARGVGTNAVTTCWIVGQGINLGQVFMSTTTIQISVRAQDLVGPQNLPPSPPNYVRQGPSACSAQPTFVGVPISLYFVPVNGGNNMVGTPYMYSIPTDLVGPPPPVGVKPLVGDTLFTVNWTPNIDTDTQGYDIFVDPIPGQEEAGAPLVDATPAPVLVCPDTGASAALEDATGSEASTVSPEASTDAGDDGSPVDATASSSSDAGCYYEYVGGSTSGSLGGSTGSSTCTSVVLSSGIVQDSGVVVQQTDEAGNPIEGGLASGSGGLSTIPSNYLVGAGNAGLTVSDKNTGTFTITGVRNGTTYNVVVAAVDGFGNVGPPSTEVCDYPAPVNDFWNLYRQSGGRAGGGCALGSIGEPGPAASGLALIAAVSALARRRRASRRETSRP